MNKRSLRPRRSGRSTTPPSEALSPSLTATPSRRSSRSRRRGHRACRWPGRPFERSASGSAPCDSCRASRGSPGRSRWLTDSATATAGTCSATVDVRLGGRPCASGLRRDASMRERVALDPQRERRPVRDSPISMLAADARRDRRRRSARRPSSSGRSAMYDEPDVVAGRRVERGLERRVRANAAVALGVDGGPDRRRVADDRTLPPSTAQAPAARPAADGQRDAAIGLASWSRSPSAIAASTRPAAVGP